MCVCKQALGGRPVVSAKRQGRTKHCVADLLLTERADHRRYELEGGAEQLGVGAEASARHQEVLGELDQIVRRNRKACARRVLVWDAHSARSGMCAARARHAYGAASTFGCEQCRLV